VLEPLPIMFNSRNFPVSKKTVFTKTMLQSIHPQINNIYGRISALLNFPVSFSIVIQLFLKLTSKWALCSIMHIAIVCITMNHFLRNRGFGASPKQCII